MNREERELGSDGGRWRASVARRGPSGHALVYFVPLEDGEPAGDDRRDRRAGLDPGRELSDLPADELRARLEGGTELTATERRFRAPDGRLWLVQNVGPVWAEEEPAEGTTGLVFTSLEGPAERLVAGDGHVGRMSATELADRWRAADPGHDGDGTDADGGTAADPDDH